VTYLLTALFFTVSLLGAAVAIHMNVRGAWREILLALRGEWGEAPKVQAAAPHAAAYATTRRHAAF
jgi:hypothetical protein